MTNTSGTMESVLLSSLRGYIEHEAKRLLEEHLEQIGRELQTAVSKQIGATVVELSNMVSFERGGLNLQITVHDRREAVKP